MVIKLTQKLKVGDKEIEEINLDLDGLSGNDTLNAERMARAQGDMTPQMMFSQTYQLCLAAKASGITVNNLKKLSLKDVNKVYMAVNSFLFA